MALNRRRRANPNRLDATALLEWYSPYDLDPSAPLDRSRSWNNYVVLAINGYGVSSTELAEQGFVRWSNTEHRDQPRPRHRSMAGAPNIVALSEADTAVAYPIFAELHSNAVFSSQELLNQAHLSHWQQHVQPEAALRITSLVSLEEMRVLAARTTVEAGHLATLGFFDWTASAFADRFPGPSPVVRRQGDEERMLLRAMRGFHRAVLPLRALLQDETSRAPFGPWPQPPEGSHALNGRHELERNSVSQDDRSPTSDTAFPLRPRRATRRIESPGEPIRAEPAHDLVSDVMVANATPDEGEIDAFGARWIAEHLGSPTLPRWESIDAFNSLSDAILAELRPRDGIEAILAKDFIESEWELRRLRAARDACLREATIGVLLDSRPNNRVDPVEIQDETWARLVVRYMRGDEAATTALTEWFSIGGQTLEGATSNAYLEALPDIRQLESLTASCMFRRNAAFNTLIKRRDGVSRQLNIRVSISRDHGLLSQT
jgi:hypothetical protein